MKTFVLVLMLVTDGLITLSTSSCRQGEKQVELLETQTGNWENFQAMRIYTRAVC
jgi:hypothetical protein